MKNFLFFIFLSISSLVFGQARIVISNGAWIVIDSSFLVIDNPSTNAVTTMGIGGGNISSEGELDRIRWNIGNSTGNYVIPFTSSSGVQMPLSYNVVSPGSSDGSVVFSTYNWGSISPSWNNNLYRPSDVTHMGNPDGSDQSVDRFWIIDTKLSGFDYSINPTADISFVYDRNEVTAGNLINSNTILFAQRFNSAISTWGDYIPPPGTFLLNSPTPLQNSLNDISIPSNQFFRSWTLVNIGQPLPVEISRFESFCNDGSVIIEWSTSTEFENNYFIVERSTDGVEFDSLGMVDGSGNSLETIDYSFIDNSPESINYYRICQVDYDGDRSYSSLSYSGCESNSGIHILNASHIGNYIQIVISSEYELNSILDVFDSRGKSIVRDSEPLVKGTNIIKLYGIFPESGVYFVTLSSEGYLDSRKFSIIN